MFCIIAGHFGIASVNHFVYTFHVPLFFLLSGYFLSKKMDLKAFAKKKVRQLLLPYVVVGVFLIPCTFVIRIICGDSVEAVIGNISSIPLAILYGSGTPLTNPFYIRQIGLLWFLPALFFALMTVRVSLNCRYPLLLISAIALFGLISARFFWLPLSLQSGFIASFFVYLGYLARHLGVMDWRPHFLVVFALASLWALCVFFGIGANIVNGTFDYGFISVVDALGASYLILLAAKYVEGHLSTPSRFLEYCGQATLIMMCFHAVADYAFPNYLLYQFLEMGLGFIHPVCNVIVVSLNMAWAVLGISITYRVPVLKKLFFVK